MDFGPSDTLNLEILYFAFRVDLAYQERPGSQISSLEGIWAQSYQLEYILEVQTRPTGHI